VLGNAFEVRRQQDSGKGGREGGMRGKRRDIRAEACGDGQARRVERKSVGREERMGRGGPWLDGAKEDEIRREEKKQTREERQEEEKKRRHERHRES
jgi:hypothetical protein